jgi:hypothetical protein
MYVAVWTSSADFPTKPGAFDTTHNSPGVMDLAYVKLKPDGSGLVYSTFVGGAGTEQARGSLCVDASGCLYSSGWTDSTSFPTTPGVYQRTRRGGTDALLLKLSADGSQLALWLEVMPQVGRLLAGHSSPDGRWQRFGGSHHRTERRRTGGRGSSWRAHDLQGADSTG